MTVMMAFIPVTLIQFLVFLFFSFYSLLLYLIQIHFYLTLFMTWTVPEYGMDVMSSQTQSMIYDTSAISIPYRSETFNEKSTIPVP
jgi:hypothetical protein